MASELPEGIRYCERHDRYGACHACEQEHKEPSGETAAGDASREALERDFAGGGTPSRQSGVMSQTGGSTSPRPKKKRWSNAKPTDCTCGRKHASKMEARVCARLRSELRHGQRLYHQVRLPLFVLPPTESGVPHYLTVDFLITRSDGSMWVAVDAKSKGRVSRDWRRGAAAFEATYGIKIEETDR